MFWLAGISTLGGANKNSSNSCAASICAYSCSFLSRSFTSSSCFRARVAAVGTVFRNWRGSMENLLQAMAMLLFDD